MTTWTTLEYKGVEKALQAWGICRSNLIQDNQADDSVAFDLQADFGAPDVFPFGAPIIIRILREGNMNGINPPDTFSGGKQKFVGFRNQHRRVGSGRLEGFKYKFSGMWEFFFERHEFQKVQPTYFNGKLILDLRSQVNLGESVTTITQSNGIQTTQQTIAEALIEISEFTLAQTVVEFGTPQFQVDTKLATSNFDGVGGWEGYFPIQGANDITCAEAIKKCLQIVPQSSAWFDYSTSPPTFRVGTRNTLGSVTLPMPSEQQANAFSATKPEIERRDDLIPPCIDLKYKVNTTVNGVVYPQTIDDMACALGYTNPANGVTPVNLLPFRKYFSTRIATFDFSGGSIATVILNTTPIPFLPTSGNLAVWKTVLASALSDPSIVSVAYANDPVTGSPVSAVLTNPDGTPADPRYLYYMVGGPCPTSVFDTKNPNLAQGVQLTLSQNFTFTENGKLGSGAAVKVNTKTDRKTISLYCYSIPGGSFSQTVVAGEAIPYGLAKFIYDIESVPQYQGTWTITEEEVTDVCPMGTNLNISGGLAEWENMNAQIQQITYDLLEGTTELTFGPARHLGPDDFIERIRLNRGPRWVYYLGGGVGPNLNPAISGPTQLKDTSSALVVDSYRWLTTNPPIKDGSGNPIGIVHVADGSGGSPATLYNNGTSATVTSYDGITVGTSGASLALLLSTMPTGHGAAGWQTISICYGSVTKTLTYFGLPLY